MNIVLPTSPEVTGGIVVLVLFILWRLRKTDKAQALPETDDDSIQKIINDAGLNNSEKKSKLAELLVPQQFTVEAETPNFVQFVRRKKFSLFWAFFWFLFLGFGLILYYILHMTRGYERVNMDLGEDDVIRSENS